MADFLTLCQGVARESGVVSGVNPTTVVSQAGQLLKIVEWTARAWEVIQNRHQHWRWMRKEWTGSTSSGTAKYTGTSLASTNFSRWARDQPGYDYFPLTLYLTATGVSDEGALREITWEEWRQRYGRGTQTNSRPTSYAISPANELCLGPIPDAAYTLNGEQYKDVQVLSGNTDTPECPSRFHDAILYQGLILLAEHDEAPIAIATAKSQLATWMDALRTDQLDFRRGGLGQVMVGAGPLA